MAKYSTYIELSPHYESVVDIGSESRNPLLWQEYIVHEDMQKAIEAICDSLKYEDKDKRRSFWIHGAYGTGKSYAAIVIKHLFEDKISEISKFLSKQMLIPYRERFLSIRQKGDFLVIWMNQATDIHSGVRFLMTMEAAIRDRLKAKFGNRAYYGKNSLIAAAQKAVEDVSINWGELFLNPSYAICEEYGTVKEFREDVKNGSLKAADTVARIYRDKGWGFFTSLQQFKEWIADVIEGNHLQDTGIIFIWDEFTSYLRNNPTDDVLQPLSEFCKEQPFFMFLIVHKAPSWLSQIGEEVYEQIIHRYHSLDFHVSEAAAYEMIGSSILTRVGMEEEWNAQKDKLIKSISKNLADFDNLDMSSKKERFRQLCPLHPMTLSLLAIVAQSFGAAQRSIFRFMKDPKQDEQNVGFRYYINNFSPDDWRWLTPDFLWDYFFTRESDVRTFSREARDAYQNYINSRELISDPYCMHVFKAAMLLIAVMSAGSISHLYSQATQRKVSANRSTLYKCFAGQLSKEDVDGYLSNLEEIGVLRHDEMANGDWRLQTPYTGSNANIFENRKTKVETKYTRYELFKKNGIFAKAIESKIWDRARASYGRMYIAACDAGKNSIKLRFEEVQEELGKCFYKFGILVIVIKETSQFATMVPEMRKLAAQDTTKRLAIYLLRAPLTQDHLERWYSAVTNSELAGEEGKSGDAGRYRDESDVIVEEWAASAKDDQLIVVCGDNYYPSNFGTMEFASKLEKEIIFGTVFTAAPELIVSTSTAFKKIQQNTVLAGVKREQPNTQIGNIINGLKQAGVWDIKDLQKLAQSTGSDGSTAIGKVADFLLQRFSQGVQIKLSILWQDLQKAPFGYYNNMASGYILGFLLQHYVNSGFSWNRGDNNPWPLTIDNLATMITDMCKDNVVNHYLSPGSELWRKFRPYVTELFDLQDGETVNETEARKYLSKQCTEKAGAPFWVLKYVAEKDLGGLAVKQTANEIIDLFCNFMAEKGDQEQVINNIITKFKGQGSLRKTLKKLYFEKSTIYDALSVFISQKTPELLELQKAIGLTNLNLFDSIHQMMQGQVSTWTEEQVEEKLEELCIEYKAVAILDKALSANHKNIKALSDDIANVLNNMKVPGSIIKELSYPWFPALQTMHRLTQTKWSMVDVDERGKYVSLWGKDASLAWNSIISPKAILQKYLEKKGINCTGDELDNIYKSLRTVNYDSPAGDFEERIEQQLEKVKYMRYKARIQELWKERSGFDSILKWCNNYAVPIQWVVVDETLPHILTLKKVQGGGLVENSDLYNAVEYFKNHEIAELKNKKYILDRFFVQIGENYRKVFEKYGVILVARLKTDKRLTSDVFMWANKAGEIRDAINLFLQSKHFAPGDLSDRIKNMSEAELRRRVLRLIKDNQTLYFTYFMD